MLRQLTWESSLSMLAFELKQEIVIMREANKAGDDFTYPVMAFTSRFDYGRSTRLRAEDRLAQDIFLLQEKVTDLRSRLEGHSEPAARAVSHSLRNIENKLKLIFEELPFLYMKNLSHLLALDAWVSKQDYVRDGQLFDSYKEHLATPGFKNYRELQLEEKRMRLRLQLELERDKGGDPELLEAFFELQDELAVQTLLQGWEAA